MKSVATTLLAGLMLLGTVSAIATSKTQTVGFSDGGPAPVCLPSTPNCPPPIPSAKSHFSDGGPAPVCLPSTPNCPPPIPGAR
jgi:hypothetical protein